MSELCNAAGVDAASNRGRSDAYGAQVQILRQQHEIFAIDRLGERVTPPLAELLASSVAVTDRELLKVVALSLAGLLYIEGLTWARLP